MWPRQSVPVIQQSITAIRKWWAREDLHLQGSQILDLWGLLFPLNHSPQMMFPAGISLAILAFGGMRSRLQDQ
jgi:hypothetical protein